MPVEEQLVATIYSSISGGDAYGQRLTISARTVTKLAFWLSRTGTPGGTLTFEIRKVSDNSAIASKLWGNSNDVPTTAGWVEVTLTSAVTINEEVRILAVASAGSAGNLIQVYYTVTSVKASEQATVRTGGNYADQTFDAPYRYTYFNTPLVTTEATTAISGTTATGHGTIVDIGASAVTQHGHCWATAVNPTTADSKTTNGAGVAGAFTSAITGLTVGQKYYVRAYATNTEGTGYGGNISFVADYSGTQLIGGNLAIIGTTIRYMGYDGVEYYIQGIAA